MSREIKVRALFELQEGGTEWRTIGINEFHGDRGDKQISPWLQYVGLTDKHGVEIYESDIIEYIDNPTNLCSGTFEVIFDAGFIGIHSHYGLHLNEIEPHKWATVIGNIHSTPELLTPKQ